MRRSTPPFLVVFCSAILAGGLTGSARQGAPLAALAVPVGFQAEVFAEKVENARSMALGSQGTVFVGSLNIGKVHAVVDSDGDHKADRVVVIASGLDQPNGVATTEAQTVRITRGGSRAVRPGPGDNFTGGVRVEMLFEALEPSHASGGSVTFEPGARTAWHSHPRGQILIVTAGTGRVQRWGDAIEEIRAGDVVRIPAGQKHWHGASPEASMTHTAISEHRDGTTVQWMEHVSDGQYNGSAASTDGTGRTPARPEVTPALQSQPATQPPANRPSGALQQRIAPGLATLTDSVLFGDVWRRPDLSPRDRSLVTISILIATGKAAQLAGHLGRALTNGVQPSEASGLLAHLAIYCGWPNAVSALEVYEQVYIARKVDTGALRAVGPRLPARRADDTRAKTLTAELAAVAPTFLRLTNDVVFDDLWRRSDLNVRDRSLVTIAALAAMGDDEELDFYLHRGVESGLTRAQIAETLTHLGFYAGWARATKAMRALTRTLK